MSIPSVSSCRIGDLPGGIGIDSSELLIELRPGSSLPPFRRGDTNASNEVDISDAVATFGYIFLGNPPPTCLIADDSNGGEDPSGKTALDCEAHGSCD